MQTSYSFYWWLLFPLLLVLSLATGCARVDYHVIRAYPHNLPVRTEITEIPFYPQKIHQCGPAALAMALNWSGSQVSLEQITAEIYTPGRKGTLQPLLISATRQHDRLPYVIRELEDLMQELGAGHPLVVLQNNGLTWLPRWHYAVLIGYDLERQLVILRSGEDFRKELSWSLFHRTWERAGKWGLMVLPLTELPASASEVSYLEAVVSLEKVKNWRAAATAYETALKRWPKSQGALMGLGNCRYALGNLVGAEKAFRRAIDVCPTCGDSYNNLAHVLSEQKRYDAAMKAAQEALRLGGPNREIYRQTLEEIEQMKTNIK
jgi:hypothetical protein